MWPSPEQPNDNNPVTIKPLLELLLFVDRRAASQEQIEQVQDYIESRQAHCSVHLQVIEVSEQPDLVEYYRLVVAPALVKISPAPRQVLAGSNLLAQLQECWPEWEYDEIPVSSLVDPQSTATSPEPSAKIIQLSDEIFRLQQEKDALLNQLKFKDQILAVLAHDLRNPLTAAAIALETLEGQWDTESIRPLLPSDTLLRLTRHARSQTQVIERMISNLLEAARGGRTSVPLKPHPVSFSDLCQTILTEMQGQFSAKCQTLTTDIPSDLPCVLVDAHYIRQVVINLLDNATKYTPADGSIQVSAFHRTNQKVQVNICDNGLGIPLEKQDHIFEDKFRLSRDQNKDGYGLGLAFCKRIVRAHYGHLWVDSTPNKGSCFHFTLPVYPK